MNVSYQMLITLQLKQTPMTALFPHYSLCCCHLLCLQERTQNRAEDKTCFHLSVCSIKYFPFLISYMIAEYYGMFPS